jgi:hypothetical protein
MCRLRALCISLVIRGSTTTDDDDVDGDMVAAAKQIPNKTK